MLQALAFLLPRKGPECGYWESSWCNEWAMTPMAMTPSDRELTPVPELVQALGQPEIPQAPLGIPIPVPVAP